MASGLTHLGATFHTSTGGGAETAPAAVKAPPAAVEQTIAGADLFRVAVVHTEWNTAIIAALLDGAMTELTRHGVAAENITVVKVRSARARARENFLRRGTLSRTTHMHSSASLSLTRTHTHARARVQVPGAFELPYAVKRVIHSAAATAAPLDAMITLGCLIKGETMHFEYICEAVSRGIMDLNVAGAGAADVPVIFGVLAVLNEDQARARAGLVPGSHNHGVEWAATALKMAALRRDTAQR